MPFTYYARDSQSVQMQISVFQRLGYPVAYFEARFAGYLIPINTLEETMRAIAPCNPGGGV
jgi:hypothetical protein